MNHYKYSLCDVKGLDKAGLMICYVYTVGNTYFKKNSGAVQKYRH